MVKRLGSLFIALIFVLVASAVAAAPAAATPPPSGVAGGDRDCSDFNNQAAAQDFFLDHGGPNNDPHGLDADGDGIACESNPCPCNYDTGGGGGGDGGNDGPKVIRQWAKVIRIIDGDTLKVRLASGKRATVRMVGIDTPETNQCGFVRAKQNLKDYLPRGTRVKLISDRKQPLKDRYDRILRYVHKLKSDMNKRQVKDGWAKVLVVGDGFTRVRDYRDAQRAAKNDDLGIWGAC